MKVKYYPYQPHCFAFGGFDMQMLNTLDAVKKLGIDASKLDIWSRDSEFDIIHLWGIGPHNYHIIDWVKKANKKLVATVLLPYFVTYRAKLSYWKHYLSKQQKQLIHFYSLIDKIVVVNESQASVLNQFYKVPFAKIFVIPHIVEDKFFKIPNFNFVKKYGIENYVLCTGNISQRKNQLNLAKACINLNINLVLIGNCLDGESSYGKYLEELIKDNLNVLWIKGLNKGSEELASAYYDCLIFALPSNDETQPISALEAVAMNKPIILQNRAYANQKYYKNAILCNKGSVTDIEKVLNNFFLVKKEQEFNKNIIDCQEINVGNKYVEVYKEICSLQNTITQ